MPLDVIMPALGMAQETGHIVAWHKSPGEAVAEGDVLFEVETDKATMEVEAQGAGYLTEVTAEAGAEVPVGQVIARISDTPEGNGETAETSPASPEPPESGAADLPEGHSVIMPTLGMAQDTGLLVGWLKELGDWAREDDILFEVETDKSTVEVPAGARGYLAARLAQPGEEVPVGQMIAILTAGAPESTVSRSASEAPSSGPAAATEAPARNAPNPAPEPVEPPAAPGLPQPGRILASPKARRLAMEQGLDLSRLERAGYPQPYHVRDIETLKALPLPQAAQERGDAVFQVKAEVPSAPFAAFADWVAAETGQPAAWAAFMAAFAAGALRAATESEAALAIESAPLQGLARVYQDPDLAPIGAPAEAGGGATPDLRLRDFTGSPLTGVSLGAPACPALTVSGSGESITVALDFTAAQLPEAAALALISGFAGRLEDPLRHLL